MNYYLYFKIIELLCLDRICNLHHVGNSDYTIRVRIGLVFLEVIGSAALDEVSLVGSSTGIRRKMIWCSATPEVFTNSGCCMK